MKALIISDRFNYLKPLTYTKTEPMIPIAGRPLIDHMLNHLRSNFINDISLTMEASPSEELSEYFEVDNQFEYLYLDEIFCATTRKNRNSSYIDDTIILFQGDVITDINLRDMIGYHKESGSLLTVALSRSDDPGSNDEAKYEKEGPFNQIETSHDYPGNGFTCSGIYITEPETLDIMIGRIEKNIFLNKEEFLFPFDKSEISYFINDGFSIKLNNIDNYIIANQRVLESSKKQISSDIIGDIYGEVNIGENTKIGESIIMGPTWIGDDVEIGDNNFIGPYTCIGNGTHIESNCDIGSSVIFEDVFIGEKTYISDTVIGEYCVIGNNVSTHKATIGGYSQLGSFVEMMRNSILWPFSYIRNFSTVDGVIKRFISKISSCDYNCILTDEESFYFNTYEGTKIIPTGRCANNIFDFLEILETIDIRSIEFHLRENFNDFAQWPRLIFNDNRLAEDIETIYEFDEDARAKLIELFSSRILEVYTNDKELIENAHCIA
ncbi:MAG: sugar phosphate nucleotidyltransferase [Halobacteriota archaeon]|nr:sugar phosphate nucleotidyltransferase [Halobacteriota archaeon]